MKKQIDGVVSAGWNFSVRKFFILPVLAILMAGAAVLVQAQPDEQKTGELPSLNDVKVLSVAKFNPEPDGKNPEINRKVQAGIEDKIIVKVEKLENLVKQSTCKDKDDQPVADCTPKEIVLYLDGREIKGLVPESGAPDTQNQTLHFHLKRSDESDEAWSDLLGAPPFKKYEFYYRPTALSVGLKDGYPMPSMVGAGQFDLIRINVLWFWICLILVLLVFLALILLARHTELLRDTGALPPEKLERKWWSLGRTINTAHRPYSLARFQMAFWFTLVIIAFLFIWVVNGAFDTITTSILGLIGIGAGTALGAAIIDSGQNQANDAELTNLQAEQVTLTNELAAIDAQITPPEGGTPPDAATLAQLSLDKHSKQNRLTLVESRITDLSSATDATKSKTFILDVLTDGENGISFHRFQMFVWTLILGILFVHNVYYRLSMPEFDGTLLALLGISSGTYLGFKIPENATTTQTT